MRRARRCLAPECVAPECIAIVRAITSLGRSLRIGTIAEGAETEAQFEILVAEGCTEVQGYLFGGATQAANCRR